MVLLIFADSEGMNCGPWYPGDAAILSVLPNKLFQECTSYC